MADRVERLTNLLALLLETSEPLSLVEIAAELDGQYPVTDVARRQAFERDKQALRDLGVPIDTEILAGGPYAGQTRYWIDRDKYELTDLDLEPDEMQALQVAVAAVRTGSGTGRSAIWKLGGALDDEQPPVSAHVPDRPELPVIRAAVASRSAITFGYRGDRSAPRSVGSAPARRLLVRRRIRPRPRRAADVPRRPLRRGCRVDRRRASRDRSNVLPTFDPRSAFPADPKQIGQSPDEAIEATVRIDAGRAAAAVRELGDDRVLRRHDDGSIDVRVPADNLDAFRSWVLGLLEHAVVLEPPELRPSIVTWLTDVAEAGPGTGR